MSELEEKLGQVLNNPQMMQQIFSLAQTLGQGPKQEAPSHQEPCPSPLPNLDPKLIQGIATLARQNNVDQNQEALLQALSPYLSQARVGKLQRAMRAARMAGAASAFLNAGGMQLLSGR